VTDSNLITHRLMGRNRGDRFRAAPAPAPRRRLDADGRTVADIAAEIAGELGWAEQTRTRWEFPL
jgi:hypothetical protein